MPMSEVSDFTEVFICFHSEDQAVLVLDTAERWRKTKGAYPTIIQCPEKDFEIKRRMLADKLAKTDPYIIADICCVPAMPDFIDTVQKMFGENDGLVGLQDCSPNSFFDGTPDGIRVCRKGIVDKWPKQVTNNYNKEHMQAVSKQGKNVATWPGVLYLRLMPDENLKQVFDA